MARRYLDGSVKPHAISAHRRSGRSAHRPYRFITYALDCGSNQYRGATKSALILLHLNICWRVTPSWMRTSWECIPPDCVLRVTIRAVTFEAPDIPGATELVAWFDRWPTFHDAEVLSIMLDRSGGCQVAIHAFEMTLEVDTRGHYVLAKHATVTFCMEGFPQDSSGITHNRIEFFNHQNVLSNARVNTTAAGYELVLEGCYGVDGLIVCERMSVKVEPAISQLSINQPAVD
jgi:hypothetical protein